MRDSFNYTKVSTDEDNINGIEFNTASTNILTVSSNLYYGYQPQMHIQGKTSHQKSWPTNLEQNIPDNEIYMDIQFSNLKKKEYVQLENSEYDNGSRKRHWRNSDELNDTKKRRKNDESLHSTTAEHHVQIPSSQKSAYLRKPTHNIPDLPRCIMENEDTETNILKENEEQNMLEDILRETHGVSIYHWLCSEV